MEQKTSTWNLIVNYFKTDLTVTENSILVIKSRKNLILSKKKTLLTELKKTCF